MQKDKKKSFILYSDYEDILKELSREEIGDLFIAIFKYENSGEILPLTGMAKMAFVMIKKDLDRNALRYEEILEKKRIAGAKGGKQRVKNLIDINSNEANQASATFAKHNQANQADNDNVNDNGNGNDNVNVNVNDNVNDNSSLSSNSEEKDEDEKAPLSDIQRPVSSEEREILKTYLEENYPNIRNPKAYLQKLIKNGDYAEMLEKALQEKVRHKFFDELKEKEREKQEQQRIRQEKALAEKEAEKKRLQNKMLSEDRIKRSIESISDKHSAASILSDYYEHCKSPPPEFDDIVKKYDLDSYDKVEECLKEYAMNKCREIVNRARNSGIMSLNSI